MSLLDSIPVVGSYRKSSKAEDIVSRAKRQHRRGTRNLEEANKQSQDYVDALFDLKVDCATSTISNAIAVLEKCQKINRTETTVAKDSIGSFTKKSLPRLKAQSLSISDIASEGAKGTTAGAALSLGSMSAVSALGSASTGTAISTLSGAAASNATMAWFGGGALSAGGAGVAGGAMVLGGIALAPVLVVGAFKYASHAEKKLTEANEYRNQVREIVAQIDAAIEVAESMNKHVELFSQTLLSLRERLIKVSDTLAAVLEYDPDNVQVVNVLKYQLILFIKAVKRLLEVTLFDSNQNPMVESIRIINHANATDEDASQQLGENLAKGKQVVRPSGVNYLSEIEPGVNSSSFFWLLDTHPEYKTAKSKKKSKAKPAQADFSLSDMSFKSALMLTFISLIAVGYGLLNNLQETPFLLFSGLFLFTFPPFWVAYKTRIKLFKIVAWLWFGVLALAGLALA